MNPLMLKVLPWGLSAIAILGAVVSYGNQREADGRAAAAIEQLVALQKQYTTDSTANVQREQLRQIELAELESEIVYERQTRKKAETQAKTVATTLRATLTAEQAVQLDALEASHEVERASWQAEEKKLTAQLGLKDGRIADLEAEVGQLQSIKDQCNRLAAEGRPGFVSRVAPYVLGTVGFVGLTTLVVSVAK